MIIRFYKWGIEVDSRSNVKKVNVKGDGKVEVWYEYRDEEKCVVYEPDEYEHYTIYEMLTRIEL